MFSIRLNWNRIEQKRLFLFSKLILNSLYMCLFTDLRYDRAQTMMMFLTKDK